MAKHKKSNKNKKKNMPTLDLKTDRDIGMDFAGKAYRRFDKMIKAIVLFGSTTKGEAISTSDVDIIVLIDDASINWDQELISWYREELGKIVSSNPYNKELHINTVKMTTWWSDLMKGDPVVINILRYGDALIDVGGFFNPLKSLLLQGRIKSTPEAIYSALERAPEHFARSKMAILSSVEGIFWSMTDSSQAALMSTGILPPSPEHIPSMLKETFVDNNRLKMKYVAGYRDLFILHKQITHGTITNIKGEDVEKWHEFTQEFLSEMIRLVKENIKD